MFGKNQIDTNHKLFAPSQGIQGPGASRGPESPESPESAEESTDPKEQLQAAIEAIIKQALQEVFSSLGLGDDEKSEEPKGPAEASRAH